MSRTVDRLVEIFGNERVEADPEYYSATVGFKSAGQSLSPDFRVYPQNAAEVQQLVRLANEISLPLIPVSSEAPHESGGVAPTIPGAVVVDLTRMKKILHVDRRSRLALIEPGVTWTELSARLAQDGLRITPPLLPKNGKSVIATLLDREPLLSPKFQWNMNEPLRAMEIVWGTGDKIYSGMGGHRGESEESWAKGEIPVNAAGPHQFDFIKMLTASQGTFGIVTWASVKVEVSASHQESLFFEASSFAELSDFLYRVVQCRFGDEVCVFNRKALSAILAEENSDSAGLERRLSPWTAFVNVKWGALRAEEKVAVQVADIKDIAQANGVVLSRTVAALPASYVSGKVLSLSGDNRWKHTVNGTAKEVFFLSTIDRIPALLEKVAEVADRYAYSFGDCPVYLQPLHQGTALHCHIVLPLPAGDGIWQESQEFYEQLSRGLAGAGAFYSRPYGLWSDIVYESNAQHTILTKKMKQVFDPGNIMNPGKLCF